MIAQFTTAERRAYVEAFLECMAPGEAGNHCFQAFDDSKILTACSPLFGSFAQHQATLEAYSAEGYGIFWTVNETNGRGRKETDIVRVRAVWLDIDVAGRDITPIEHALPPHCVIETSKGKHHLYWRVSDCALEAFTPLLDAVTDHWKGDVGAKGINRVLRLPGFLHQKPECEPFVSRVVRWQT